MKYVILKLSYNFLDVNKSHYCISIILLFYIYVLLLLVKFIFILIMIITVISIYTNIHITSFIFISISICTVTNMHTLYYNLFAYKHSPTIIIIIIVTTPLRFIHLFSIMYVFIFIFIELCCFYCLLYLNIQHNSSTNSFIAFLWVCIDELMACKYLLLLV